MKRFVILSAIIAASAATNAHAFPGGSVRDLLRMLMHEPTLPVDTVSENNGCGKVVETKKGDHLDVGDLLAFLVEKLSYGEGKNAVRPECDPQGEHKMTCILWFTSGAGTATPWRAGMRFSYDPKTKKVLRDSVGCVN